MEYNYYDLLVHLIELSNKNIKDDFSKFSLVEESEHIEGDGVKGFYNIAVFTDGEEKHKSRSDYKIDGKGSDPYIASETKEKSAKLLLHFLFVNGIKNPFSLKEKLDNRASVTAVSNLT